MCDSFVALPSATRDGSLLFAKSADTEINEAQELILQPARASGEGAGVRVTHLVIPQARQTHEVLLDKSFWLWGAEIGFNEHGLAGGNEAVFTTVKAEPETGVISGDLLRLMLERARDCEAAIGVMAEALAEFGQGGNCELRGNSHFDSSFLIADTKRAFVIDTAGRDWAAREIEGVGSISNMLSIGTDWSRASIAPGNGEGVNFKEAFGDPAPLPGLGCRARQALTQGLLEAKNGDLTIRDFAHILRHHGEDYDPARGAVHENICMHAGPFENRYWQATGALITEASERGCMAWATATSGNCLSIFKPVFFGVPLPEMGPAPRETVVPDSLWWRHERLHRRAMAGFADIGAEVRADFEALERRFFAEGPGLLGASAAEKRGFVEECWRLAAEATERWVQRLEQRSWSFADAEYGGMWDRFNRAAAFSIA
jgi:dipeptidase